VTISVTVSDGRGGSDAQSKGISVIHTPVTYTQNIVNGTITVPPGYCYPFEVSVTSSMSNARLVGAFTASGGSGNDIYVYIMDETDYVNWSNGHQVTPIYNSGKVTTGSFTTYISSPGTYYLVYDNTFSSVSSKDVATAVNLKYEQ
jgi:hypothetical protein